MSAESLSIFSTQFSIYVGLPICIFGIIGNLINLRLLFPTRSNSSSFLLFFTSFFNIIGLSAGLLPRILAISFNIDKSSTSMIWCKIRFLLINSVTVIPFTCLSLASIDRFLVSCRNIRWRNRSKLSTTKTATLIVILVNFASYIPFVIFFTIIEVKTSTNTTITVCSSTNSALVRYVSYFVRPVLLGVLPCIILGVTGWLTYRNITSIAGIQFRGTFQRSLTSMILLQIITVIISIIPFATICIYQLITSSMIKSSYQLAQEAFVFNITNITLYISCSSSFYVYLISASSYRRDFLRFVFFFYSQDRWNNRIGTLNIPAINQQVLQL